MLIAIQDVVQEFRVATNNISPEYGRFGGGVVNMATKSGTNEFHGSAYEYFRNKVLNANDFFAKMGGQERVAFNQNQYGVTLADRCGRTGHFSTSAGSNSAQSSVKPRFLICRPLKCALAISALNWWPTGAINPCTGQPVLKGQIFDPLTTRTVGGQTCRDRFQQQASANRINFTADAMANKVKDQ